jgi:hypothetical protein
MPSVGFEPKTSEFERMKAIRQSVGAATVIDLWVLFEGQKVSSIKVYQNKFKEKERHRTNGPRGTNKFTCTDSTISPGPAESPISPNN